jgi:hypothetical protein
VRLTRNQQDVIAPGIWLVVLVALGFFARPLLVGGGVISTLVLGLYYAARDADMGNPDRAGRGDASHD